MQTIHFYTLIDPRDNTVFYVGSTQNSLAARLAGHIHDARNKRLRSRPGTRIHFIKQLLAEGGRPLIKLIVTLEAESNEQRLFIEYRLIYEYSHVHPLVRQYVPIDIKKQILKSGGGYV